MQYEYNLCKSLLWGGPYRTVETYSRGIQPGYVRTGLTAIRRSAWRENHADDNLISGALMAHDITVQDMHKQITTTWG